MVILSSRNFEGEGVGYVPDFDRLPLDQYATVPTLAERAGNIPGLATPIAPVPQAAALLNYIPEPNLPGTVDEHPNWRRRLPAGSDMLFDEPGAAARVAALAAKRPRL